MPEKDHQISCSFCVRDTSAKQSPLWKQKEFFNILLAGVVFIIGLYFEFIEKKYLIAQLLFLVIVFVFGFNILNVLSNHFGNEMIRIDC